MKMTSDPPASQGTEEQSVCRLGVGLGGSSVPERGGEAGREPLVLWGSVKAQVALH